jgi:hypothetical protein
MILNIYGKTTEILLGIVGQMSYIVLGPETVWGFYFCYYEKDFVGFGWSWPCD